MKFRTKPQNVLVITIKSNDRGKCVKENNIECEKNDREKRFYKKKKIKERKSDCMRRDKLVE